MVTPLLIKISPVNQRGVDAGKRPFIFLVYWKTEPNKNIAQSFIIIIIKIKEG